MLFKNLTLYKFQQPAASALATDWSSGSALSSMLAQKPFTPCTKDQAESIGFVAPSGGGQSFAPVLNTSIWITLKIQTRTVPAAAIREAVAADVKAIEQKESRKVGSKEKKALAEAANDALLSQTPLHLAKTVTLDAYIDIAANLLIINTASTNQAETFCTALRKALGSLPVVPVGNGESLSPSLTSCLLHVENAPENTTIGTECVMESTGDDASKVTFKDHCLYDSEVSNHLSTGKIVTKLGMIWKNNLSFVINESGVISKLKFLDVFKEQLDKEDPQTKAEIDDIEFVLMTGEVRAMVRDLRLDKPGAEPKPDVTDTPVADIAQAVDISEDAGEDDDQDPLYDEAVELVVSNNRPTISFLQRKLKIGYNRAASFIEAMERDGTITTTDAVTGDRTVNYGIKLNKAAL